MFEDYSEIIISKIKILKNKQNFLYVKKDNDNAFLWNFWWKKFFNIKQATTLMPWIYFWYFYIKHSFCGNYARWYQNIKNTYKRTDLKKKKCMMEMNIVAPLIISIDI